MKIAVSQDMCTPQNTLETNAESLGKGQDTYNKGERVLEELERRTRFLECVSNIAWGGHMVQTFWSMYMAPVSFQGCKGLSLFRIPVDHTTKAVAIASHLKPRNFSCWMSCLRSSFSCCAAAVLRI